MLDSDIDQCIDNHRAKYHQDPAVYVLEEVETVNNDEDNVDDDDVLEISDRKAERRILKMMKWRFG